MLERTMRTAFGIIPLSVARLPSPRRLVSVYYHMVSEANLPHVSALYSYKTPDAFEQDLLFLKRNYTLVTHDQVLADREGRVALPPNAAQISFDDGFSECFDIVRPLLLKHQAPCTFFLMTGTLDNRSLMYRQAVALCLQRLATMTDSSVAAAASPTLTRFGAPTGKEDLRRWIKGLKWVQKSELDAACAALGVDSAAFLRNCQPYLSTEQAMQLHRDGFTLGAHSCDHPNLADLRWEQAAEQIVASCRFVAQMTGKQRVPFAIPFNGVTLSRDRLGALRSETGMIDLIYDTNNLRLERNWIVNRISADSMVGYVQGRSNLKDHLRRAHLLEPARELHRRLTHKPR